MTYTPNSPTSADTDSPAVSQPLIKDNYAVYNTAFSANHNSMNSPTQGNHSNVIMKKEVNNPLVTGDWGVLYCKDAVNTVGTFPEIFFRTKQFLPNQGTEPLPQQVTYNQVSLVGPNFQSFMFAGYVIYFGTIPAFITISTTITLIPSPTKLIYVNVQVADQPANPDGRPVSVTVPANNQFTVFSLAGINTFTYTYIAIGTA